MKNFIKLTEVKFEEMFEETGGSVKVKYYDDYIRPASICFIERIIHKGQRVCLIHFEIGDDHAKLLVKESPEEIDEIIDDFYKGKKGKASKKSEIAVDNGLLGPNPSSKPRRVAGKSHP